jgi:hypothetical protein
MWSTAGRIRCSAGGLPVIAAAPGGVRLSGGAQAGQAGVPGGVADLAELVTDPLRRPGGLDGIGVAQVQQHPIRHPAHVRAVDRAEGGQGFVPGCPQVRGGRCGRVDRRPADRAWPHRTDPATMRAG